MYRYLPLKVAECRTEEGPKLFYLSDWDRTHVNAFYFWYLEGGGRRVLFDTGFDVDEGGRYMPTLDASAGWAPEARLRSLGVEPSSIDAVVVSHLHFDHLSSAVDLYPNAVLYIQKREIETAFDPPHPWFTAFYIPAIVERLRGDLAERLRILDGDATVMPGMRVVRTGGHTPGHQALLFESGGRTVGLTGDLCFHYRNLEEDHPIGLFCSLEEIYTGMARMRRDCDIVHPGHDPRIEDRFAGGR